MKALAASFRRGDFEGAAANARALLTLDPSDRHGLSMLAAALGGLGHQRGPIDPAFRRVDALIDTDVDLLWNLQFYLIDTNRLHDQKPRARLTLAERCVDRFFANGGKLDRRYGGWGNTCNTYLAAKRYDDAIALAERGLGTHRKGDGYDAIIDAYGYQRDRTRVLAALRKAKVKKKKTSFEAYYTAPSLDWLRPDPKFAGLFASPGRMFAKLGDDAPEALILLQGRTYDVEEDFAQEFTLSLGKTYEKNWSKAPQFREQVRIFAAAAPNGTDYALWRPDGVSAEQQPVLVLGGEGGVHVVASDAREFLRLLGTDYAPRVSHEAVEYRDRNAYKVSPGHRQYVGWLSGRLGLEPPADPTRIVKAAQNKWQRKLKAWLASLDS